MSEQRAGFCSAMPEKIRFRRQVVFLVVGALSLVASACGSSTVGEGSAAETSGDAAPTSTDAAPGPAESVGPEEAADGPSPAVENLFPDIDVVNIADSSTYNLAAELGGGDLPVLLWFWAPH